MKWIRVKIVDVSRFQRPDICPNCLETPADHVVAIKRTFGIPFLVAASISGEWPFCQSCARLFRSGRRLQWLIGRGPGMILILIALGMAFNNASLNAPTNPVFPIFWTGLLIAIFGTLAAKLIHANKSCPAGCLSNLPTVKPIQITTTFTGKAKAAEYSFLHPIYVEQLRAMNPPDVVVLHQKKLQHAVSCFEARHAN